MTRLNDSRSSFMAHDLLSNPDSFINESLYGTALINQDVAVLGKYNTIIRRNHKNALHDKVKILSGCSSGHEPAFASYVGEGMITAAVQGNIFQSPNQETILATLRELGKNHLPGVFVIIKNTVQERINFQVAVYKAINEKIKIRMLVVRDDCFGDPKSPQSCLGSTGVILIAKIAGALAEAGDNLDDIYNYCKTVTDYLRTCNAALRTPLPVNECSCTKELLNPARVICELGIGTQGEIAKKKIEIETAQDMVSIMLDHIFNIHKEPNISSISTPNSIPLIVMVNNLGSITLIEEKIITMEVVRQLRMRNYCVQQIYCGTFLTSLDMRGFSITIASVIGDSLINALRAPTKAYAWKNCEPLDLTDNTQKLKIAVVQEPNDISLAKIPSYFGGSFTSKTSHVLPAIINFALDALISSEKQLNIIDSIMRDGDTGTNLSQVARYLQYQIASGKIDKQQPGKILWSFGKISETRFPGTLGTLYTVGFYAAAEVFMEKEPTASINGRIWIDALEAAINKILMYGEISIGDKTFVDSLNGALLSMKSLSEEVLKTNALSVMSAATEGAEFATINTIRVQNPSQPSVKYPDAGAQAVATWMRAIYEGMKVKMSN